MDGYYTGCGYALGGIEYATIDEAMEAQNWQADKIALALYRVDRGGSAYMLSLLSPGAAAAKLRHPVEGRNINHKQETRDVIDAAAKMALR